MNTAKVFKINNTNFTNNTFKVIEFNSQKQTNESNKASYQSKTPRTAANGTVNAITSKEDIQRLKEYFLYQTNKSNNQPKRERNYALVTFGLNTALRASDILNIKVSEIFDENNNFKNNIIIREQKTKKKKNLYLNSSVKDALSLYMSTRSNIQPDDYLFESGKSNDGKMTVTAVGKLMRDAGRHLGLSERLGSHSMRKSFARHCIQNNPNNPSVIISVSQALNHSSPSVTYRYADITKTEIEMLYENNQL